MIQDPTRSHEGLLIQAIGIVPLAVLSFLLSRSIQRPYLRYWWQAWASLAVALFALYLAFTHPSARAALEPFYFLGEYLFGGLIVAGCRSLATGASLARREGWLLLPAALLALLLTHAPADFSVRFIPQAAILSALCVAGFLYVRRTPAPGRWRVGHPLLRLSLLALALSFLHYVPVLGWAAVSGRVLPEAYTAYTSLFDLLAETFLGFGTLIVVMEDEHRELEAANAGWGRSPAVDPLTDSLNRHAFYSMVEGGRLSEGQGGCVAVVDVDALKPINDTFGHAAGDAAIRAVARAIRHVVRADDLVFRWGGDEFLVVLFGVSEDGARQRLDRSPPTSPRCRSPALPEPLSVTVSGGVAAFDAMGGLERAIEVADDRMYRSRQARRLAKEPKRGA